MVNMSMVIKSRTGINDNIKFVANFLDTQYLTAWNIDDLEQDILCGYTDIHKEIKNMRKALGILKQNNNNKMISKCLQLLSKEN